MSKGYRKRAAKVDDNQADIVEAFRLIGCSVADTSPAGSGFPDLVVGFVINRYPGTINVLVEVKDGEKPPSKRKLTPKQEDFHNSWVGPIEIAETTDDVMKIVRKYRLIGNND